MRMTLKDLIEAEDRCIRKMEDYGRNVEEYAAEILKVSDLPVCDARQKELDRLMLKREEAVRKRDAAMKDMEGTRAELKRYILNILYEEGRSET